MENRINRYSNGVPHLPPDMRIHAQKLGFQVYEIVLDEPNSKADDAAVSLFVMAPALPRKGELIHLHDGKMCIVRAVSHRIVFYDDDFGLAPTVRAEVVATRPDTTDTN